MNMGQMKYDGVTSLIRVSDLSFNNGVDLGEKHFILKWDFPKVNSY